MTKQQQYRLMRYIFLLLSGMAVLLLVLSALREDINFYTTPEEFVLSSQVGDVVQLGGFVKTNSLRYLGDLKKQFILTDNEYSVDSDYDIVIDYEGILPNLFRDGQGLVMKGYKVDKHIFHATKILAKHDAGYKPPNMD